jgi:hypothetical protein
MRKVCVVNLVSFLFLFVLECQFYLAPSLIPGAVRGVIAGKDYQEGDLVDLSVSLVMPSDLISHWQLFNYVYSSNVESFSMALFGAGMLYNHMNPKNLDNYWHSTPSIDAETYRDIYAHPYTAYTEVEYVANRRIQMGEELFASYGDGSDWFTARGIELSPLDYDSDHPPRYSHEFLSENGHCMTNIEVKNSSIPLAGRGIFARKAFKKGEIVSISPVLVIPKHDLEPTASHSVFLNYCFLVPNTDLALFPIGLGGLINHGGTSSNVEIDWFDWSSLSSSPPARLNWTAGELEENPFAPLDFQYIATQDIAPGEEILLNYGLKWEEAWGAYLEGLKQYWLEFGSSGVVIGPQFRSAIEITSNMFLPPHLQATPCVGKHGCGSSKKDLPNGLKQKAKEREVRQRELQQGKEFIEKHFKISVNDNKEASSTAGGEL